MDTKEALRLAGEGEKVARGYTTAPASTHDAHVGELLVGLATAIHEMLGENQKLEEKLKDCQSGAAMLEEVLSARLERAEEELKEVPSLIRDLMLIAERPPHFPDSEEVIERAEAMLAVLPDTGKEK